MDHKPKKHPYLKWAVACITLACVLGLHLRSGLELRKGVYEHIFLVFGVSALFAGTLYVLPPLRFWQRSGGELFIAMGMGFLPVLGAYLVQVGDITRRVYLASLPIVVATGLWIWIEEMASREDDEKSGRNTLVQDFGARFSGRYGVPVILAGFFLSIVAAVVSRSVPPSAFALFVLIIPGWKIIMVAAREYAHPGRISRLTQTVFWLHFATCFALTLTPLISIYISPLQ